MLSGKRSFLVLGLLILALAGFAYVSIQASAQGKKPKTVFTASPGSPPNLTLTTDRSYVTACADAGSASGSEVVLRAEAIPTDSRKPVYVYHWTIKDKSGNRDIGQLSGNGSSVTWNLAGVPPGTYTARVDVDTDRVDDCAAFRTTTVRVEECPPPTCPTVVVSCPSPAPVNGPVTFTANISGITGGITPTYNWTVSQGTIINGQGTTSIQVATTGVEGQPIRATLNLGGYNLTCSAYCTIQVPLLPINPRKFDEFPNIKFDDEKARLDNYAIQLQTEPGSRGYIIIYPGARDRSGDAQRRANRARDYLVNTRGIDDNRLHILTGGQRASQTVELWLVPTGATPPTPGQ